MLSGLLPLLPNQCISFEVKGATVIFCPIEMLTMEEGYKRLLLTGWELLVSSFSLIFHLSFISVGLHYAPPLAQTQMLFFLCGSVGGMVLIIKSKAKIISSKIPEPLCIHLSFHGFLKASPTCSLGNMCSNCVSPHLQEQSHMTKTKF